MYHNSQLFDNNYTLILNIYKYLHLTLVMPNFELLLNIELISCQLVIVLFL